MAYETTVHDPAQGESPSTQQSRQSDAERILTEGGWQQNQQQPTPANPTPAAEPAGSQQNQQQPAGGQPDQAAPGAQQPPQPTDPNAQPAQQQQQQQQQPQTDQPKPEEGPLKDHYAELIRREGALTRRELALQQRESEVKSRETGIHDLQTLAKEDPLAALEKIGLTFQGLTNHVLSNDPDKGDAESKRLVRDMAKRVESVETAQQQAAEAMHRQQRESELRSALDKNESYELTRFYGQDAIDFAMKVMDRWERDQGFRPDAGDVLQAVESFYADQASRLTQLPKVRSTLATPGPQAQPNDPGAQPQAQQPSANAPPEPATPQAQQPTQDPGAQPQPQQPAPSRTLSNDLESNAPPRQVGRPLTDEELRQRAIAVMEEHTSR